MDILIDETHGGAIWAAAIDDTGRLYALEVDSAKEEIKAGSIYRARVERVDPVINMVFLNLDGDHRAVLKAKDAKASQGKQKEPLQKMFQAGDMILIQVKSSYIREGSSKEGFEVKLAEATMDLTLAGRYMIYTPFHKDLKISRRVQDRKTREAMKTLLDKDRQNSVILRASAANIQTEMLIKEYDLLNFVWTELTKHLDAMEGEEPQLVMEGPDAIIRLLSNMALEQIDRIEVVTLERMEDVQEWCDDFAPDLMTKIEPVELDNPYTDMALFHLRDVMGQIETLGQNVVTLPNDANMIFEPTAATLSIDINRGSSKDGHLRINLEAAREVARQLRLRHLNGPITIDFISMKKDAERDAVIEALENAFADDPVTVQIHGFTKLGMVEVTRARRSLPLAAKV